MIPLKGVLEYNFLSTISRGENDTSILLLGQFLVLFKEQ